VAGARVAAAPRDSFVSGTPHPLVGGIARRRVSVLTNHERQTGCGFSAQETVSHTDVTMA
jgi:hypothetical protein